MAIVRLDKVQASDNGNIESVKHTADMTNGLFFNLGGLVSGERELRDVSAVTEATIEGDEVVLHATPEVMYDPRKSGLKDFVLSAGKAGRAYHLTEGDIITLTSDLFNTAPTVGQYAVPDYDGSMKLEASTDGTLVDSAGTGTLTPRLAFEVIEQTTLGYDGTTAYAIQVVRV